MKKKKLEEKVFTKKKGNDIISKDYNPFEVNCKIYERRSELQKMEKENKLNLEKFINQRIMDNTYLFSDEELTNIRNNNVLIQKIYILGMLDTIKN